MKTVLIGSTYVSAATSVATLAATELGIFAGTSSNHFTIGSGFNDLISQSIHKKPRELVFSRTAAITAVKEALSIEFANVGTNAYDEFIIRVNINYYGGEESRTSNAKDYSFTGIYANAAAVATKAAAVINADGSSEVVATVAGNTVVITPLDKNKTALLTIAGEFVAFATGVSTPATIVKTASLVRGVGDKDYIKALASSAQYPNDRTRTEALFPKIWDESGTDTAYPYDVYYIGFLNPEHIDGNGLGKAFSPLNEVWICMPAGAEATEMETALEALFGVTCTNGAA